MSGDDRAWFIQELIAALQEQGELAPGAGLGPSGATDRQAASDESTGAESSIRAPFTGLFSGAELQQQSPARADLAAAAYDQLQFDFPQVADHQIKALAEVYRSFASSAVSDGGSVADFALTRTLVEGIAYLNERNDGGTGGARKSEASSMLAASVLLELVRYCVEKRGSPKVRALLAKLTVPVNAKRVDPTGQYNEQQQSTAMAILEASSSAFVEKYATQEDPDDLGEVYEGGEPTNHYLQSQARPFASQTTVPQTHAGLSKEDEYERKLCFLTSHTFSSSFAALSVEKWLEWGLDDAICALIRLLVESKGNGSAIKSNKTHDQDANDETTVFGTAGEWTRYLYILRDRLLRFPASSQRGIQNLKELVEHFQTSWRVQHSSHKKSETTSTEDTTDQQQPHHVLYRVLAELVVSKEFQQRSSQRAQESLVAAIYDLLPLIVDELQLLSQSRSQRATRNEPLGARDSDLVVIFLQLLHFLMLTAANVRAMAERLHESGILRTLLTLLPAATTSSTQEDAEVELAGSVWFRPLFRLVGECALWHEGVAVYISRVPKAAALLPSLPVTLPAEAVVLSFAFHQHRVGASSNVWELFASPALFPPRCESFLDAMEKVSSRVRSNSW